MDDRVAMTALVWLGLVSFGWGQQPPSSPPGPPGGNRFTRRAVTLTTTGPAATRPVSRTQELFEQANDLALKLHRSGPWEKHAQVIGQSVESLFAQHGLTNETEQFVKRLLLDVTKVPPWDFNGRLNVASKHLRERYGLNDEQVKTMQTTFIRMSFAFFVKNAEKIVPTAREIIETRLENKPYTPERVARWAQTLKPVMVEWYNVVSANVDRLANEHLTPEQRQKLDRDLSIVDRRLKEGFQLVERWEKGEWTPEMWGLEKDLSLIHI